MGHFGPFGWRHSGWREVAGALAAYSFLFLAGVLALFSLPRRLRVVRDAFGRGLGEGFRLFGVGVLGGLALLLLTALGLFVFVAAPLSLALLAALLLAVWGGLVALALALGRGISRRVGLAQSSPLLDLALGNLLILTLGRLPVAGWFIVALLGALALGAVIVTRFGSGDAWSLAEFASGGGNVHE